MRKIGAAALAMTLMSASAFAATVSPAPLAPGKPSGVEKAQFAGTPFIWVLGLAFIGAGIGLAASGNGGNQPATTTTSTAP